MVCNRTLGTILATCEMKQVKVFNEKLLISPMGEN